ncbi:MAG: bifunctional demethylmenaquinone methyltransferase/2-methoxy-6-polyprenyl-1,4-benzoquinol methylase UbiE [Gemmatales bacterium]|nr:bifunctional demethylmenaquinone methyltransferase/2-methoxy-6-polyprenyl-1,4-benzoquinol methylase UbiE [Gemmatales bacterium]MCS7161349.1 bifunctional demethylmenaquinone methyltransferase/2-methoxy-6-polyprenyl-1,4-benzoquinol methylase UbiE [Gemmatales bacterium]MDW8176552.1 bifunctional demethylmenaquinone methyltransferase/2-methoxy-6-polyprenyl-1,4-benzoquinol methylase UbiE [Gemmatales bacterium]MDW8222047.1 bifunctional demethylmenaquinone methyltransferase/2-methoxy-6-polyprenyl-1,4
MKKTSVLDKSETRIRRMFGTIAPTYDLLNHLLSCQVDRYWRWQTTRLVPPQNDGPILDVCTGTGDLALAYWKAGRKQVPVIGADFASEMLALARRKAARRRARNVVFVQADAQALPFRDNQFQIVSVAFGLRNITDYRRGLAEMVRVARPAGQVVILEFSRPSQSLWGKLYQWYFRRVLPCIGQLISGQSAYYYLPASVFEFPDGEALAEEMRCAGLQSVWFHHFAFRIATLYVGTKPGTPM